MRFPDNADFIVSNDTQSVNCIPLPNVPVATCEHLYINQVHPLLRYKQGKLVLHGSAVSVDGRSLAFIAQAGRGKSTLAAAFAVSGFAFLSDDCIEIEFDVSRYYVMPSHPSIRLWKDSEVAVLSTAVTLAPPVHYTSKSRFIAGAEIAYCDQPRPLAKIFLLGDGSAPSVRIKRLGSSEAIASLLDHSFILDVEDKSQLKSHFDRLAALVNKAPCFHLDFPRRYEELGTVLERIRAYANSDVVAHDVT